MRKSFTVYALITTLFVSGCANMSDTQKKTGTGAGIGAATGAVLGAITGPGGWERAAIGAAIGGLVGGGAGYLWGHHMDKQKEELQQATRGTGIAIQQTKDNRILVSIPGDLAFANNSATISPAFQIILNDMLGTLKNHSSSHITIIGYMDNTGPGANNTVLPHQRAENVMRYLVSQGIAADRFTVAGQGTPNSVTNNQTTGKHIQNHRMEIYIGEPSK